MSLSIIIIVFQVGLGRNGTLFAMVPGTVKVTTERTDLDTEHVWNRMFYGGKNMEGMLKEYYNVIPKKDHSRFKLIDKI